MEVIFDAVLDAEPILKVPKRYEIVREETKPAYEVGPWKQYTPRMDVKLPSVELPIKKPEAHFTDDEMVMTFDFDL
jgi:hypothetical protein